MLHSAAWFFVAGGWYAPTSLPQCRPQPRLHEMLKDGRHPGPSRPLFLSLQQVFDNYTRAVLFSFSVFFVFFATV